MTISEWANVAEIVGLFAVVITLIFVGLEIRNNTKQAQADALNTGIQFLLTIRGMTSNPETAGLFVKDLNGFEALSTTEKAIFHSKMHEISIEYVVASKLVEKGLLVDMDYQRFSKVMASLLLSPGVIKYLELTEDEMPPFLIVIFDNLRKEVEGIKPMSESLKFKEKEE